MLKAKLEEVAEIIRLLDELEPFKDKMGPSELTICSSVSERLKFYGEATYISENEVRYIRAAYTRILDSAS
jgi:hypothetical protein